MHFGICSFNLEITRNGILIEAGRLFGAHLSSEPMNGRRLFDAYWLGMSQGTRGWSVRIGPVEASGHVFWRPTTAPQNEQHSMHLS